MSYWHNSHLLDTRGIIDPEVNIASVGDLNREEIQMKLKLATVTPSSAVSIHVRDMKAKQFAVVVDHAVGVLFSTKFTLVGEIIYRDYAGWHGLTGDRFWPSTGCPVYVPEMRVRPLVPGEMLEVIE